MTREETIIKNIADKFPEIEDKYVIARERRIFIDVNPGNYRNIIDFLSASLSFNILCTITGLDVGDDFQVIYHIANTEGIIVNLKLTIPKSDPQIDSVTGVFNGCALYERELVDMFGIIVNGLPEGHRYPLPDSWPEGQHPLRKDWKPDSAAAITEGAE